MTYPEWLASVPQEFKNDALWTVEAYRLALFLGELAWHDVTKLMRDRRMLKLADQLHSAVGSVSANIAEGYSRTTGRERARFYEFSLGSARESRDWYYKARHLLGDEVFQHRLNLLTQITKLLLRMVPDQRQTVIKEEKVPYEVNPTVSFDSIDTIPMPSLIDDHPSSKP